MTRVLCCSLLSIVVCCSTKSSNQKPVPEAPGVEKAQANPGPDTKRHTPHTKTLPLSISIETKGGVSSVMIPRGTTLPTEYSEIFSTGSDNQDRVQIHVLQGERRLAKDNRTLGKFQLFEIPPAPTGVPQIQVIFSLNAEGTLEVKAKDLTSDRTQKIRVSDASSAVRSDSEIAQMLRDAKDNKEHDEEHKRWSDARGDLGAQIAVTREFLKQNPSLPKAPKQRCESQIAAAEKALIESSSVEAAESLEASLASLNEAFVAAAEAL